MSQLVSTELFILWIYCRKLYQIWYINVCEPLVSEYRFDVHRSNATRVNKLSTLSYAHKQIVENGNEYTHTRTFPQETKSGHKKNAKFIHKPLSIQSDSLCCALVLSAFLSGWKVESRIARIATISVHLCIHCVGLYKKLIVFYPSFASCELVLYSILPEELSECVRCTSHFCFFPILMGI